MTQSSGETPCPPPTPVYSAVIMITSPSVVNVMLIIIDVAISAMDD